MHLKVIQGEGNAPQMVVPSNLRLLGQTNEAVQQFSTLNLVACIEDGDMQPAFDILGQHYAALDSDERLQDLLQECVCSLASDLVERNSLQSSQLLAQCNIRPLHAEAVVVDEKGTLHLLPQAVQLGAVETQAPSRLLQLLCGHLQAAGTLKSAPRGAFAEPPSQLQRCMACNIYADDVDEAYELCDSDPWGEPSLLWTRLTAAVESSLRGLLAQGQLTQNLALKAAQDAWWPVCMTTAAGMAWNRSGVVLPSLLGAVRFHALQSRLPDDRALSDLLDERDWQDALLASFAPTTIEGGGQRLADALATFLDGMLAPGVGRH